MKNFLKTINQDVPHIKGLIKNAENWRQRAIIRIALVCKAAITLLFCLLVVLAFVEVIGANNAIVGVVVLLSVLTFQKIHLGYNNLHGAAALSFIFALYAFVPLAVTHVGPAWAALINAATILIILILGCHRVEFQNHIVLVLSYLLLIGYPAPPPAIKGRVIALLLGGMWAASILYRKNKGNNSTTTALDVIKQFNPKQAEDEWKIKLALLVPLSMLCGQIIGLHRPMWIGIAAMSVLTPHHHLRPKKAAERVIGSLIGSAIFYALTFIPGLDATKLGMAGGFLVGLTTSYKYQTIFNSLGALSVAMMLLGTKDAVASRIVDNVFAVIFVIVIVAAVDWLIDRTKPEKKHE